MRISIEKEMSSVAETTLILAIILIIFGPFAVIAWETLGAAFPPIRPLPWALLTVIYFATSVVSIKGFISIIQTKGYFQENNTVWLWLIGLFTTPITLGLFTVALPEKKSDEASDEAAEFPSF